MPDPTEYHVVSFIAQVPLHLTDDVINVISNIEGGEVHATSPEGKIVFTVEGLHQKDIDEKIIPVKDHSALHSLSPVYHQFLDEKENTLPSS